MPVAVLTLLSTTLISLSTIALHVDATKFALYPMCTQLSIPLRSVDSVLLPMSVATTPRHITRPQKGLRLQYTLVWLALLQWNQLNGTANAERPSMPCLFSLSFLPSPILNLPVFFSPCPNLIPISLPTCFDSLSNRARIWSCVCVFFLFFQPVFYSFSIFFMFMYSAYVFLFFSLFTFPFCCSSHPH